MSDFFTRLQEGPVMTLLTQDFKSYFSAFTAVILGFVMIYFAFFSSNRQKSPEKKVDTRSVHKDEKSQSQNKDETTSEVVKERGISQGGNKKKKQELVEKKPNLSEKVDVTQKSLPNTKHEQIKDDANIETIDSSNEGSSHSNGSSLYEFQATEALVLLANQSYCQQFKNATVNKGAIRRIITSETSKKGAVSAATTLANNNLVMRNVLPKQDLKIYKNEETKEKNKEKKEEEDTVQFIPDKEGEKVTLTTGGAVLEEAAAEQKVKADKCEIKNVSSVPLVNEISEPVSDLETVTPSPVVIAGLPEKKEEESKQCEVTTANKDEGTTTEAVNENKTVDPISVLGAIVTGAGILEASREICATKAEEEKSDAISESKPAESIPVTSEADSEEIKTNGDITTTVVEEEVEPVQEIPASTSSTESDVPEENKATTVTTTVDQTEEKTAESLSEPEFINSDVQKISVDREIADEKADDATATTVAAIVTEAEKSVEPIPVPEKAEASELPVENKDASTVPTESNIGETVKPVTLASTPVSELPIEDTNVVTDNKKVAIEPVVLTGTPASEEPKARQVTEIQNTTAPVVEDNEPVESAPAEEPVIAEESKDREVTKAQGITTPIVDNAKPIKSAFFEEPATASAETKVQEEESIKDDTVTNEPAAVLVNDEKPTESLSVTESASIPTVSDDVKTLETSMDEKPEVASGEEAADITPTEEKKETIDTKAVSQTANNAEPIDVSQQQEADTDKSFSELLSAEEKESKKPQDSIKEKEGATSAAEEVKSIETHGLASTDVDEVLEDSNKAKESDDQIVPVVLTGEKPVEFVSTISENNAVEDPVNREVSSNDKIEATETKDEQTTTPEGNTTLEKSTHIETIAKQPNVDIAKKSENLETVVNGEKNHKEEEDLDGSVNNETVSREINNKDEPSLAGLEPNPTTSTVSTVDSLESNVNTSSQTNNNFEVMNGYMGSPFSQNNFHQMYAYPKMSDPATFAAVPSAVTPLSQPREKRFLTRIEKIDRQIQSYAPRMKARCTFWPNCTNKNCKYWHPIKECRMGQNCTFRNKCMFLHPNDMVDEQPRKRKAKPVHNK